MSFDSDYKPALQPPSWVFGPVWAFLYTSMFISIYLVWASREQFEAAGKSFELAVGLFVAQLILNFTWTYVFNSEWYWISTLMLIGMIVFTSLYANEVLEVSRFAAYLVVPYILWLSFATLLNVFYLAEASN